MQTEGRMTRARARALAGAPEGATPAASKPTQPDTKSTTRARASKKDSNASPVPAKELFKTARSARKAAKPAAEPEEQPEELHDAASHADQPTHRSEDQLVHAEDQLQQEIQPAEDEGTDQVGAGTSAPEPIDDPVADVAGGELAQEVASAPEAAQPSQQMPMTEAPQQHLCDSTMHAECAEEEEEEDLDQIEPEFVSGVESTPMGLDAANSEEEGYETEPPSDGEEEADQQFEFVGDAAGERTPVLSYPAMPQNFSSNTPVEGHAAIDGAMGTPQFGVTVGMDMAPGSGPRLSPATASPQPPAALPSNFASLTPMQPNTELAAELEATGMPQEPQRELSELSFAEDAKAGGSPAGSEPMAPAAQEPPVVTPVAVPGAKATFRTPKSAVVSRAMERAGMAGRSMLTTVKPAAATGGTAAFKKPVSAARTAVTPVAPKPAATPTPAPASHAVANVASAAKRVSISTPFRDASAGAGKTYVRTPWTKSTCKADRDDDEEEEEELDCGDDDMLNEEMAADEVLPAEQSAGGSDLHPSHQETPGACDAAMLLAASLPSSGRVTVDDLAASHAEDVEMEMGSPTAAAAAAVAAAVTQSGRCDPSAPGSAGPPAWASSLKSSSRQGTPGTSLEVHSSSPAPAIGSGQKPASRAAGTPEGGPARSSPAMPKHLTSSGGFFEAKAQWQQEALAHAEQHTSPAKPKLTVPLASASFMASTKASQAKHLAGGAEPRAKARATTSASLDSRSLGELRREIKKVALKKKATDMQDHKAKEDKHKLVTNLHEVRSSKPLKLPPRVELPHGSDDDGDDEEEEAAYNQGSEDTLMEAMQGLKVGKPAATNKSNTLRGVPAPQGTHIRFDDSGKPTASPTSGKVVLKGVPVSTGTHKRWM